MAKFNYIKWVTENKSKTVSKPKPKKFNAQKKSEILQQMFALKEQTNTQTQTGTPTTRRDTHVQCEHTLQPISSSIRTTRDGCTSTTSSQA